MDLVIVFDLDGTLITCENKQKFVLLSILNCHRNGDMRQKDLDKWWELKRNGLNTEKALKAMGFSNAKLISDKWKTMVENFTYNTLDHPFEDSLPCLRYLKTGLNSNIIILTSRNCRFRVIQSIKNYGFEQYLDDVVVVKPENSVAGKRDHLRKIKPSVFIGDSEVDYTASLDSGVNFIALTRGQRSREFLEKMYKGQIEDDLTFMNDNFFNRSAI